MKIALREIKGFLKNPPDHVLVILVYGRDEGLVYETALKISSTVVDDLTDPFKVSEFSGKDVVRDPSRLFEEATAQSLVGGKRIVRVRLENENISEQVSSLFDLPQLCALILLEAGNLKPSSPVRRLLEKHPNAAVIPCYQDNQNALTELILEVITPLGITVSRSANDYLLSHLGSDRMISRRELEKLVLYVGNNNKVSLEDAMCVVGDSSSLEIEHIVFAATSGEKNVLSANLTRAAAAGIPTVALLRATQRHVQRLLLAHARLINGKTPNEAIKSLKPPVLFIFTNDFRKQLNVWTPSLIKKALDLLTNAETLCKSTGLPDRIIGERVLLQLAQMANSTK